MPGFRYCNRRLSLVTLTYFRVSLTSIKIKSDEFKRKILFAKNKAEFSLLHSALVTGNIDLFNRVAKLYKDTNTGAFNREILFAKIRPSFRYCTRPLSPVNLIYLIVSLPSTKIPIQMHLIARSFSQK